MTSTSIFPSMSSCGSCKQEITTCAVCGGKKCSLGCPDRAEDGCTCDVDGESDDE